MALYVVVWGVDGRDTKEKRSRRSRRLGTTHTYRVISYGTTCLEHAKAAAGQIDAAATGRTPRPISTVGGRL